MHPRNRDLQALLDRELSPSREAEVLRHVAVCARCSDRLDSIRDLGASLRFAVAAIDATEPASWTAASEAAVETVSPAHVRSSQRPAWRAPLRWAAVFVLGTAVVGSGAWLSTRLLIATRGARPAVIDAPAVTAAPPPAPAAIAGSITVAPVDGAVALTIENAAEGSLLFAEFGLGRGMRVEIAGDVTPQFRAGEGTLNVRLEGGRAAVRVTLPAGLRSAVVRAGDREIARVREGQLEPPDVNAGLRIR